ncbi:MAG: hypothetical protein ACPHL4_06245 [Acidimicrobiales bacterium]|nr:hypothetical protein [Acidimicrobiaceae bacterium]|tara:strand:- start:1623 stop:2261 length:639 start_codon:yes stop_codon:yes gene_type:complete
MKILQRQIQFRPECSLEGPAKVAEMVSYLNSITDFTWYGWQTLAGGPVGSCGLSTRVDSWSDLMAAQPAMVEDAGWVSRAAELVGMYQEPAMDWVMSPIAGSENMPAEPSEILVNTINRAAFHNVSKAIDLSQQFVNMVNGIAGTPAAALMTPLGEGGCSFAMLLYYGSIAEYEERNNPEVWSMVGDSPLQAEAQNIFDASATQQIVARRIA